jgi:hypothetical protein
VIVGSVDYRIGPEHKFPAAVDDRFAALEWVHANAASLGANPDQIGVRTGPPLGLSRDLIIRGGAVSCNCAPMAARAALCSAAFGFWRTSSRKAFVLSTPAER